MTGIQISENVGKIVARQPEAAEVFKRHDIDFCCGGARSLEAACAERGLPAAQVIKEIENETVAETRGDSSWEARPLEELIDHIVGTYHVDLIRDLPRITGWATQVLNAHGERNLERFSDLRTVITDFSVELSTHMMKEEQVLFPWIRQGNGRTAGDPIRVMNTEHEAAATSLARIRELTCDFTLPGYSCPTMEALWSSLEKLDADLREHIHLENNILFTRALAE